MGNVSSYDYIPSPQPAKEKRVQLDLSMEEAGRLMQALSHAPHGRLSPNRRSLGHALDRLGVRRDYSYGTKGSFGILDD